MNVEGRGDCNMCPVGVETWSWCTFIDVLFTKTFKRNEIAFSFSQWRCDLTRVMASSFLRFLDHTQRRTTFGRTPLDEWSPGSRDLYLTTHNTHKRQHIHAPGGFRTHDPSRRAAANLRLTPHGHWDRLRRPSGKLKLPNITSPDSRCHIQDSSWEPSEFRPGTLQFELTGTARCAVYWYLCYSGNLCLQHRDRRDRPVILKMEAACYSETLALTYGYHTKRCHIPEESRLYYVFNPLNPELNPICYFWHY